MRTVVDNAHVHRDSAYFGFLCFIGIFDTITWGLCITAIIFSRNEHNVYEAELRAYHAAGGPNSKCTNEPNTCPPYAPSRDMQWVLVSTLVPLVFDTSFLPPSLVFTARNRLHTGVLLSEAVFAFLLWASFGIMKAMCDCGDAVDDCGVVVWGSGSGGAEVA
ncbi:hypothetical protein GRF29_161g737651 [Pseudopithomyces chartarum]|uniref:Uncharacterized protein n=1 Tax=Pseudopithomyces chartarum TaxID=1892770 RepID=A0AAN6LPV5_9PLEO|nr:hypothetical protein GRF29_161g737651 [Pseudopithomyces chartarum]